MIEVVIVCEGQTEETFVRNVLATTVEDVTLAWLESLGWTIARGPESPLMLLPKLG